MKNEWQIQEAKNRFSEVVDRALKNGPQTVTRRGKEAVVIVAADEYRKLNSPPLSLVAFLRASPLLGEELDTERDRDTGREVAL